MYLTFGAFTMIPLEKINAIHFLNPLFVSIFAVIFFKEKIYFYRIISLILGFIGIVIVIRPGMISIETVIFMVLGSTILCALCIIITKDITKNDSALTILIYQCIFMSIFTLIIAYFN
jgi:drug/metabolite transporter (DMT)-like permease